jgi:hypothetical protein
MGLPEIKNPLDNLLENRLRKVRNDASYKPVLDELKAAQGKGLSSADYMNTAVQATRDEFKRQGKPLKQSELRERAMLAATAAAAETPIQLADMPKGTDKTEHFCASGLISLKAANFFDKFLPSSWAEKLGYHVSVAVGYAKEINDKFFGTGFDRDDLKADKAGARSVFQIKA